MEEVLTWWLGGNKNYRAPKPTHRNPPLETYVKHRYQKGGKGDGDGRTAPLLPGS